MITAAAGITNQSVVFGSVESCLNANSSALSIAASTISASSPRRRRSGPSPFTPPNVLHSPAERLLLEEETASSRG